MNRLKDHPFAVNANLDQSLVLTYAVPVSQLHPLLPPCLVPDTFQDQWGFVAVAMVAAKQLRPAGLPAWLGNDFSLIGYRVFVRYRSTAGKQLRGLYILASSTDKLRMTLLGKLFTHYRYNRTDVQWERSGVNLTVRSARSAIHIVVATSAHPAELPVNSPFSDWKEARRFAGPLPFTFSWNRKRKEVLIVEGVREDWTPRPLTVLEHSVGFMNEQRWPGTRLASAFVIGSIPYHWKKGRIEKWTQ